MENPFTFGGKAVAIHPLNLKQLKELKEPLQLAKQFGPFADDAVYDAVVTVVKAAIGEADVSEDAIAEGVTLGNFGDIWSFLLGVPVTRVAPGEAKAG